MRRLKPVAPADVPRKQTRCPLASASDSSFRNDTIIGCANASRA